MTAIDALLDGNRRFAEQFDGADLPIVPRTRAVVLSCADARVDPAHVMDQPLGEVVVLRNNGARVTQQVIEEIATLVFMVSKMDGATPGPFEFIIMQHTHCGAERFADPGFQAAVKSTLGIDVAASAIDDHAQTLWQDVERLRKAPEIPDYVLVSGLLYDVRTGTIQVIVPPAPLGDGRAA